MGTPSEERQRGSAPSAGGERGNTDVTSAATGRTPEDRVSNVLKWVLLAIAIASFGLFAWATDVTYQRAPPQPDRFVAPNGAALMTAQDIEDGKAAFQRADLMDYGSIYGMGSYFGEDYTAKYLVRLGQLTEDDIARTRFGKPFAALGAEDQAAARAAMQRELKGIDLTAREVRLPAALATAVATLQGEITQQLLHSDFIRAGLRPIASMRPTPSRPPISSSIPR